MNWYLIHSFESSCNGLYGIEDWRLVECEDEDEAYDIGLEDAIDVINSYSFLIEEIEDEANEIWARERDTIDENEYEQWFDDVVDELIRESAQVEIWRLQDGIDYLKLEEDLDYEEIRDNYSIKEG